MQDFSPSFWYTHTTKIITSHLCHIQILVFFSPKRWAWTHKEKTAQLCQHAGCKINTKHCLHLSLTLQWSHYVQSSVCFADEPLLKSKEKPCALLTETPHLSWNKRMLWLKGFTRGEEIQTCPWGWLCPSLTWNHLVMKLWKRERERERASGREREGERGGPVAGRKANDSFAMLVGYSATMPSSFQSSIKLNKRRRMLINQTE